MKYTLLITQRCNLACAYCYIPKRPVSMSLDTARDAVDFVFAHAGTGDPLEIGFFGGEPLLEFELLQEITGVVESHPRFDPKFVGLTVVTNGTIFSDSIASFLRALRVISFAAKPNQRRNHRQYLRSCSRNGSRGISGDAQRFRVSHPGYGRARRGSA